VNLNDLVSRTWQENILFNVLLELTYQCNLDCFFCYNDTSRQGTPLDLNQYHELLRELADLGVLNLILSGGEPLAHPDFWKIGARARELGFLVRIKSNGHALRKDLVPRLKAEIDPFAIDVSLHGASAEVHDRQTRVTGSFERLRRNLWVLKEEGLRVKLNATLTAWNEHQLEAMFELADGLGFPLHVDPQVTPRDDGDTSPQSIGASAAARQRLEKLLLQRSPPLADSACNGVDSAPDGQKHCGSGSSSLAIDPYGNVYPCVAFRRSLGNLHEQTVRDIWYGNPVLEEVRGAMGEAARQVGALEKKGARVRFCPGQAHAIGGDPTEIYPGAAQMVSLSLKRDRNILPPD
jgi:MoaA/NifB/PqqE/SkfB family radical SAM enzyme